MCRLFLITCCLFWTVLASADIYRSIDADGNIVFSDEQTEDAEKIEIQPIQIIKPPPVAPFVYTPPAETIEPYRSIEITNPQHDAAIRDNIGNVSISVSVDPGLISGHQFVLYMDGKQISSGASTSFNLSNQDRGTHSVRVSVKDAEDRIVISTKTISFHMLR